MTGIFTLNPATCQKWYRILRIFLWQFPESRRSLIRRP